MKIKFAIGLSLLASALYARAETPAALPPVVQENAISMGAALPLQLQFPAESSQSPRSVVVMFHGGGWTEGEASWMSGLAQQFARQGMVAVAVEYRLSRAGITPFDAVADARAAIRWVRREALRLQLDPNRVIALGTSAGAHLAAATAVFQEATGDQISAKPNALILRSPAIAVAESSWFRKLSGGAAQAAALSPDRHLHKEMPPSLLLQGELDNVTPAEGAKNFCQRMQELGNQCRLKLYSGVGHLFTRNLNAQENPDYSAIDQQVSQDAMVTSFAFLRELGFLPPVKTPQP